MVSLQEIEEEIRTLENGRITYSALEKLSVLYNIKNEITGQKEPEKEIERYSYAAAPGSEFMEAVKNVPIEPLMKILDEHMSAVKIVYPKEYAAVIRMIKEI